MNISKSSIFLWSAFVIIFICIFIIGCSTTIPEAPEREDDLPRQCNLLIRNYSSSLVKYLTDTNAPLERQSEAQAILVASGALLEWFGYPEDKYTGNLIDLIEEMTIEDQEYDREVSEWVEDISKFEGEKVGTTMLGSFMMKLSLAIMCGLAILIFIVAKIYL